VERKRPSWTAGSNVDKSHRSRFITEAIAWINLVWYNQMHGSFFLYYFRTHSRKKVSSIPPPLTKSERHAALARFCGVFCGVKPCGIRLRRKWFLGELPDQIARNNPAKMDKGKIEILTSALGDLATGLWEARCLKWGYRDSAWRLYQQTNKQTLY